MFFRRKPKIKRSLFRRIVNGFIYFGIGVIVALLVLFAISQTSTFREWLREKLVTTINGSINGELSIEGIDGTIFTALILNNTTLSQDGDTLLHAEKIEVRVSPLRILFKIIYFRKIEITNANITLLKDESGELNISKLSKPSGEEIQEDTTSTGFTFKFQVADLSLINVGLRIQSYENKNSTKIYENLNMDDLRLDGLNLSLNAFADISGKELRMSINRMAVKPNLNGFYLKHLSGNFFFENDEIIVTALNIETSRSDITLNAAMKKFPLFGGGDFKIEETPLQLDLSASNFNFDDLTNFIPATDLLQGSLDVDISAHGTLDNLSLRKLNITFNDTRLKASGNVKNITAGDRMFIDMKFNDTKINPLDGNNLLRTVDLPVYPEFGIFNFDTLYFRGEPLNFNSIMYVQTEKGKFNGKVAMNLAAEDMEYDIALNTIGLDLNPVINLSTKLTSKIRLKGKGTSPDKMKAVLSFNANASKIQGRNYQLFKADINSGNALINYEISFVSDTTSGKLAGQINFTDLLNPSYNLDASIYHFNIGELLKDQNYQSDINVNIIAEGREFDPDSLDLFAVLAFDSSTISGIELNDRKIIIDLRKNEGGERVINIVSNLADITLTGDFSLVDAASLIETEATLISEFIDQSVTSINPPGESSLTKQKAVFLLPENKADLSYAIEFKDFEMLSLLLGNVEMEIDGEMNGFLKRSSDSLFANLSMNVNYFKYWDGAKLFYVSSLDLNAMAVNDFTGDFPDSFTSKIKLSAKDIFLNEEFHNIHLNSSINNNNMDISFRGQIGDNLFTNFIGNIGIDDGRIGMVLDSLFIQYNDFRLWNSEKIDIAYSDGHFNVYNFKMTHNPGDIDLNGLFSFSNDQNLRLHVVNMPGSDINVQLLKLPAETGFKANLNLSAFWQGTAQSPMLNMNMTLDSVQIRNKRIGTFSTTVDYINDKMKLDVNFLDTLYNLKTPKLDIDGSLPISLSLQPEENNNGTKEVNLSINANDFELVALSGLIPYIRNLQGTLNAGINIRGTYDDLGLFGSLSLDQVSFTARPNNINYLAQAKFGLNYDEVTIDNFYISNTPQMRDGGKIFAKGNLIHKNLDFNDVKISANGKLKILGEETRLVNPYIFGDLIVETVNDINYVVNENENFIDANLIIKKGATLTFLPTRSGFSNESDKFVYKYRDYSAESEEDASIDSLIILSRLSSRLEGPVPSNPNGLNLKVKINVEDEAKMVFVLSREFQQNLTAYLTGNFEYSIINDKPVANGELVLMEGSKLEFIKPFQAYGSLKFLSDIDNPYLDITGIYRDYYLPTDSIGSGSNEKEVEIRIKIEGPLNDLNKNFIQREGTIGVYIRDNNVSDFQFDATKTSSDAIMFIIVGKFTDDATSQDRNIAASTAASFAGSLVGGFLNEKFGDYVRGVRFQQVGSETKFSLIGKAGPVRYEIGGTSQVFQDFSRANIRIEYPPITSLRNLILRLERREPLQGTTTYGEMINEFGIKYRFDF